MLCSLFSILCLLTACGSGKKGDTVRIGSKDFTENLIVAEVYALALEDAGYKIERKLNIAGSVVHTAITNNEIDIYPEYTMTGLLTILKLDLITDPQKVYDVVKDEYNKRFQITWFDQTKANDSQGLVIRTDVANALNIHTISDLQREANKIRFASRGEFDQRDDGIPGLEKIYGPFHFKSSKVYDNGIKYQILKNGEADATPAYTTEGQLVNTDIFKLLEDDKHMWQPYYLVPIIRNNVLEANPGIAKILNTVSATFDSKVITKLNAQVDVDKKEYEEVAKKYFQSIKPLLQ